MIEYVLTVAFAGLVAVSSEMIVQKVIRKKTDEKEKSQLGQMMDDILHIYHPINNWVKMDTKKFVWNNGIYSYQLYKTDQSSNLFINVYEKNQFILSLKTDEHHKLKVITSKVEGIFDVNKWVMEHLFHYRGWSIHTQYRFMKEIEKQKENRPLTKLQSEWSQYKKEQDASYQSMLKKISHTDIEEFPFSIKKTVWHDKFFKAQIVRKEKTVCYSVSFQNDILLFSGDVNIQTGERDWHFPLSYIKEEKKTQLLSVIQEQLKPYIALMEETDEFIDTSDAKRQDVFQEMKEKIQSLRQEKEWITNEEWHLFTQTYVSDIKRVQTIYEKLGEESKKEASELIERTKEKILKEIIELNIRIEKRKMKSLEKEVRVVEQRERY